VIRSFDEAQKYIFCILEFAIGRFIGLLRTDINVLGQMCINARTGPSSLPVVVAQPDKRLQTGQFYGWVVWQRPSKMIHTREERMHCAIAQYAWKHC